MEQAAGSVATGNALPAEAEEQSGASCCPPALAVWTTAVASQAQKRREKGDQPWIMYCSTRRRGGMRNALISWSGRSPRGVIKKPADRSAYDNQFVQKALASLKDVDTKGLGWKPRTVTLLGRGQ